MSRTLKDLLATGAYDAPALGAPGRPPLDYRGLRAVIADTLTTLNALDIGRGDRVAIVLNNGPEMAACYMACASGVTSAPLNPAYRADEFEFYLQDLNAKALIVEAGSASPAVAVAQKLGVRLIDLVAPTDGPAGAYSLVARDGATASAAAENGGFAHPDDVSMVLHTSGTTSRPKIVPLSQANLVASATHIGRTLRFTPGDRGLNIMPLFHIHGLIAGILAPLSAGSFVFCTPGFNALKFFAWMDEAQPTWYTAVPTMHQAILSRAGKNADVIARHPLRFIRSSSSSMPPQVIAELEQAEGPSAAEIAEEAPAADVGAVKIPATIADSLTIICGKPFAQDATAGTLAEIFGAENVIPETIDGAEGEKLNVTAIYPNDRSRRIQVTFLNEEERTVLTSVSIRGEASEWTGPGGINLGDGIETVERLNKKPFTVAGFGWDHGGFVTDWQGGALQQIAPGCRTTVRFNIPPDLQVNDTLLGEAGHSSKEPTLRTAGAYVEEISISWMQEHEY